MYDVHLLCPSQHSATLGQVPIQQATGSTIDYHSSTSDEPNLRINTSEGETSSKSDNNDLQFGSDAIDPNLELQVALDTPGWKQRRYLDDGAIFGHGWMQRCYLDDGAIFGHVLERVKEILSLKEYKDCGDTGHSKDVDASSGHQRIKSAVACAWGDTTEWIESKYDGVIDQKGI